MNSPLVSVIIPNYNHAQYLDERIQSILNQSYQNFEIIILDDCSIDNSRNIIEKYRHDSHVSHVVYNQDNSGSTFRQWERGFDLAKGELIWIAESDDSCAPTFLERLVEEFGKHKDLVLAFSTSMIMDETGKFSHIIQSPKIQKNILLNGRGFIKEYLYWDNVIYNASSAVFRKDVALTISRDYTTYKASGDWLFWIFICERGSVSMINEGLNYFRKHLENVTEKARCNGIQQIENKRIYDYLISKKLIGCWDMRQLQIVNCYKYSFFINFDDDATKHLVLDVWHFPSWCYTIAYVWHLFHKLRN